MPKLGEMLVAEGLVKEAQLEAALELQESRGGFLGTILIEQGVVKEASLVEVLTRQVGCPPVDLTTVEWNEEFAQILPQNLARKHMCIPVKKTQRILHVAFLDPTDDSAIEQIAFRTGMTIKPMVAGPTAIQNAIEKHYTDGARAEVDPGDLARGDRVDKLISSALEQVKGDVEVEEQPDEDLELGRTDSPVIQLVNGLLLKGVQMGASDVHIEPGEENVRVRYRIDGVLHTVQELPSSIRSSVVSRVKIIGHMDITERRLPQDGRIKIVLKDKSRYDFRVSVLPGVYGEKVVVRILGRGGLRDSVEDLGLRGRSLEFVRDALKNPYGMILVTGPTGSGKTTSLYTMLKSLNKEGVNILTAEDPVEYQLPGITQVNVKAHIGLTFDMALRSFLRQDPDIILVGEMRDYETAAIAIKAALTGHLVFSTLHTNDAPSTVVRLIDMGIEPYLVASATKLVIAQRLIRRICSRCREPVPEAKRDFGDLRESIVASVESMYRGEGCDNCHGYGYRGRAPVFEVMPVRSREMKRVITEGGTEVQVAQVARREDMTTLRDDVLRLVNEGVTSLDEAYKILLAD